MPNGSAGARPIDRHIKHQFDRPLGWQHASISVRIILPLVLCVFLAACGNLQIPGIAASPKPTGTSSVILDNAKIPMSLRFAPDGRLFFNEVSEGRVRIFQNGALLETPWAAFEVARGPETGLLGLALDPDFQSNHYVYLYYSEPDPDRRNNVPLRNRVVRMTDRNNHGEDLTVVLDDLPVSRTGRHAGGRLQFGPDGMLYVSVGNAESSRFGQELNRLGGKILRMRPDGSIPVDNPFPGSPVFALGFRNPFGLAFQPETGRLYANDNGGKGHDEYNLIMPAGNYGNPIVEGRGDDPRFINPLWESGDPSIGPTGMLFYTGSMFPELKNALLVCGVHQGMLRKARFTNANLDEIQDFEDIASECRLDVTQGPDGSIYYAGINKIYRYAR